MNLKNVLNEFEKDIESSESLRLIEEILAGDLKEVGKAMTEIYQKEVGEIKAVETIFTNPETSTEHQTWKNQLANQVVQPLQYFKPTSLMDPGDSQSIVSILNLATTNGCRVKAAGSGHSYSDVATTPDFFIDSHGLSAVANNTKPLVGQLSPSDLNPNTLPLIIGQATWPNYDPENNHALIEMENGITIKNLNETLWNANLGLINMGGYDAQTIIGAISTSTHGSGISLGPFPDMVRSIVLATNGKYNGTTYGSGVPVGNVYLYRIEPTKGITNAATYNHPNILLIQDDDCFNAVTTSMGCMGVIYSLVLEVSQNYWLAETRVMSNWHDVKKSLTTTDGSIPAILQNTRNFEFYQSPYRFPTQYHAITTQRNIAPESETGNGGHRSIITSILGQLEIAIEVLIWFVNRYPSITPLTIYMALKGLVTIDPPYVDRSYRVYNLDVNGNGGFASEMAYPIGLDNSYNVANLTNAMEHIFNTAILARDQGDVYQTSPMGVRFVKKSDSTLSMMHGNNMGMIEFDMVTGTYAGKETMYRLEQGSYQFNARPHWGLNFDYLSGANNFVGQLYPNLDKWMAIYNQFNSLGTFANSFTDRMGFSKPNYPNATS
jgi:hypothetical protein